MAITALEFGKTLRPTTVELVTKLNETIAAVNALNPEAVTQLSKDVIALKATTTDLTKKGNDQHGKHRHANASADFAHAGYRQDESYFVHSSCKPRHRPIQSR